MDDKTITRLSFVVTVIGIIALYAFSLSVEPKGVNIAYINSSLIGQKVSFNGTVEGVDEKSGVFIFRLENSSIDVVSFDKKYDIRKGDFVEVEGNVESYRGYVEVVADKIRKK